VTSPPVKGVVIVQTTGAVSIGAVVSSSAVSPEVSIVAVSSPIGASGTMGASGTAASTTGVVSRGAATSKLTEAVSTAGGVVSGAPTSKLAPPVPPLRRVRSPSRTATRSSSSVVVPAAATAYEEEWRCGEHESQCTRSSFGHVSDPFSKFKSRPAATIDPFGFMNRRLWPAPYSWSPAS